MVKVGNSIVHSTKGPRCFGLRIVRVERNWHAVLCSKFSVSHHRVLVGFTFKARVGTRVVVLSFTLSCISQPHSREKPDLTGLFPSVLTSSE